MGVPTWKRDLSKTEYIRAAHTLCVDVGRTVNQMPKKYRQDFGAVMIRDALDCLKFCRAANSIYLSAKTSEEDRARRRRFLQQARILAFQVSSVADVYLTLCQESDGITKDRIEKKQRLIGSDAVDAYNLISGVIRSDALSKSS